MNYITFDQIKAQLRLSDDQAELERSILKLYGNTAEKVVCNHIRLSYEDLLEQYGEVPKPIVLAALMLVDTSYQQRSSISMQNMSSVPYTFDLLLKPYMRLTTQKYDCDEM